MPPRARKDTPDETEPTQETDVTSPTPEPVDDVPPAPVQDDDPDAHPEPVDDVPPAPPVDSPDNKTDGEGVEIQSDPEPEPVDRSLTWPHEAMINYQVPHVARGKMSAQLLEAADELGYPPAAIRSQTDGFLVPSLVYFHLFPSQIPTPADDASTDDE